MFSITLVSVFILCFISYYFRINTDYWKKRNVKQVDGVLWKFVSGKRSMAEIVKDIYEAHPDLNHVGIFFGKAPILILRDIENIKAVLHGDFNSFYKRGLFKNTTDVFTDNLIFTEDYKRWKLQRLKMSPFFTKLQIKNMFFNAERCARDFVDYVGSNPKINEDPYGAVYSYTTACISCSIFGIDTETQNSMKTPLSKIANDNLKPTLKFKFKLSLASLLPQIYKFFNLKVFADHEECFINMIKVAMEKRKSNNKICQDFVNTLLKLENEGVIKDFVTGYETDASLNFLAAQAFVFVFGGIDTVANALHFALLELSNNSKVLQKLHHDIDNMFKDVVDKITFEDIEKLEYMDMVLNEVIRKYPPVGITQRKCCKDTILPNGNFKINKGTKIMIPIFALHRDKKYFPNPDVFDPERFSAENMLKIIKYSYIPFGEGRRICIGSKLAFMQMKVCLTWLLRKYTLKEQSYTPKHFEPNFIGLRDRNARYEIIPRTKI